MSELTPEQLRQVSQSHPHLFLSNVQQPRGQETEVLEENSPYAIVNLDGKDYRYNIEAVRQALKAPIRTTEELEDLKAQWEADPCWDIEFSEGFEAHHAELLAFRQQKEEEWELAYQKKLTANAAKLRCSKATAELVMKLREQATSSKESAKKLLKHYFKLALSYLTFDNEAELEELVEHIVNASELNAQAAILLATQKQS